MSAAQGTVPAAAAARPAMGTFERFLTVWVLLCIVAGIGLGQLVPGVFHAIGNATVAQVNLPVAALIWLMIVPMLLKIDLGSLRQVGGHWRGILATVGVNWLVKPFSMALLGWLYLGAFAVLLGAELNAEVERQTGRDTTEGPDRPEGRRGARVADDGARSER